MTFMNDTQVITVVVLYFMGLLPYYNIKQSALQMPLYTTEFHKLKIEQNPNKIRSIDAVFGGIRFMNWALQPMIQHLRKRGIMTYYWVCNEEEHF